MIGQRKEMSRQAARSLIKYNLDEDDLPGGVSRYGEILKGSNT